MFTHVIIRTWALVCVRARFVESGHRHEKNYRMNKYL